MLTSVPIRKLQIQKSLRLYLIPVRKASIKNFKGNKCCETGKLGKKWGNGKVFIMLLVEHKLIETL